MTDNTIKIEVQNPSELRASTPLGQEMSSLAHFAANNFADNPRNVNIKPGHTLSRIFAAGSQAKPDDGKGVLKFFRGASLGGIVGCGAAAVVFPWTVPLVAIGAATVAVCERIRYRYKKAINAVESQIPDAQKTIDRMIETLDRATKQHVQERTQQSKDQLTEVTKGFCSLFSKDMGYVPGVFDGTHFSLPNPDYKGSIVIEKINNTLESSISELAKPDTVKPRGASNDPERGVGHNLDPRSRDTPNISSTAIEGVPPKIQPSDRGFDSR